MTTKNINTQIKNKLKKTVRQKAIKITDRLNERKKKENMQER
jgi:hypothetical protein